MYSDFCMLCYQAVFYCLYSVHELYDIYQSVTLLIGNCNSHYTLSVKDYTTAQITYIIHHFQIFQRLIYADKQEVQGDGPFLDGINVTIRRNYIYEDAYDKLSPENGQY